MHSYVKAKSMGMGHVTARVPLPSHRSAVLAARLGRGPAAANQSPVKHGEGNTPPVADVLMRTSEQRIQTKCKACEEEDDDKHTIRRQRDADAHDDSLRVENPLHALGAGQALDMETRAFFEPRFGTSFEQVRVHTGQAAADSARALNAYAYTVGKDIVFGAEKYQRHTQEGKRLLAHELTHVVQQGNDAPQVQRKICPEEPSYCPESGHFPEGSPANRPLLYRGRSELRSRRPAVGDAQALLNTFLETGYWWGCHPKADRNYMQQTRASMTQDPLCEDCSFGPNTEKAVKIFQECTQVELDGVTKLERDGKIGDKTWARLDQYRSEPVPPQPSPGGAPTQNLPQPTPPPPKQKTPQPEKPDPGKTLPAEGMGQCDISDVTYECAWAGGTCAEVADDCKEDFPDTAALDELEKKYRDYVTEQATDYPNAAANLNHYLDGSGTTRTLPVDLFKSDESCEDALETHRDKFIAGAERRLKEVSPTPTSAVTWDLSYSSAANAFGIPYTDLGLAVGGYLLCSAAKVTATPAGTSWFGLGSPMFEIGFSDWNVQAFDCYNWDPGKSVPFVGNDEELCCLQNAKRGKHFYVKTDKWVNDHAPSLEKDTVTV